MRDLRRPVTTATPGAAPVRVPDGRIRPYDQTVQTAAPRVDADDDQPSGTPVRPVLSVVVPVYGGATTIVENVGVIRRAVEAGVDGEIELIVVSDGSVDATAEILLASRDETTARVIHYDRNLGKGYAVRAGALASHGAWVAFIDSDLDLDPASIPVFLDVARRDQLDFAIGSKRHPDSVVHYPRSRRVASWCYQQLNRILFRLDVRDTQVGVKVFSRDVVDNVMPLLLVKQFAFDLELLAVSHALGYGRIRELPVRLDYRFGGSLVRSSAVAKALIDTAAIFYRLRILRTYQRKRAFLGTGRQQRHRSRSTARQPRRPRRGDRRPARLSVRRAGRGTRSRRGGGVVERRSRRRARAGSAPGRELDLGSRGVLRPPGGRARSWCRRWRPCTGPRDNRPRRRCSSRGSGPARDGCASAPATSAPWSTTRREASSSAPTSSVARSTRASSLST